LRGIQSNVLLTYDLLDTDVTDTLTNRFAITEGLLDEKNTPFSSLRRRAAMAMVLRLARFVFDCSEQAVDIYKQFVSVSVQCPQRVVKKYSFESVIRDGIFVRKSNS
jgi:hypothetical protein